MIRFKHKNGAETVSKTAALAMQYWYGAFHPPKMPQKPELFKVYVSERKYPMMPGDVTMGEREGSSDECKPFLDLCVAACERTFNKSPEIDWSQSPEEISRRFLIWLSLHGDVKDITHDGELNAPETK